jgi:hypothetical protein
MTIRLSPLRIAHIPFDDLPKDFTFHVGRNEHKCSSFQRFTFRKPFATPRSAAKIFIMVICPSLSRPIGIESCQTRHGLSSAISQIKETYGDGVIHIRNVQRWTHDLAAGTTKLNAFPRPGRPIDPENADRIRMLLESEPYVS